MPATLLKRSPRRWEKGLKAKVILNPNSVVSLDLQTVQFCFSKNVKFTKGLCWLEGWMGLVLALLSVTTPSPSSKHCPSPSPYLFDAFGNILGSESGK